jgi:hypothetical protein
MSKVKSLKKLGPISYHDTWLRKRGLHPDQLKTTRKYLINGKETARCPHDFPDLKSQPSLAKISNL